MPPLTAPRLVLAVVALLALATRAAAQDLEPRVYTNTPVGLNFLIAGYAYQTGDVVTDPGLPLEDAKVHVHNAVVAYARSFGIFGKSAKADVVVPYGWADGSASVAGGREERRVDGFGDPRFRVSVNFYGAPALTLPAFLEYQQDLVVGATFSMWVPLGQYDETKLLNLGTNRFAFKPELGVSKTIGPVSLEVVPSVTLYTDNEDFFHGHTRKQDPLYAVQSHLVYRVSEALWGSLDGTYYGGGRTTIDGKENEDRQSNARLGLTLALSLSRHYSLKVNASKAVVTRVGGDFDLLGIALQYRWGGGL